MKIYWPKPKCWTCNFCMAQDCNNCSNKKKLPGVPKCTCSCNKRGRKKASASTKLPLQPTAKPHTPKPSYSEQRRQMIARSWFGLR